MTPFPTTVGGFRAVYLDCPWRFATYDGKKSVPTQAADPYATMALSDIKALPVKDVCAPDCAMFMWATFPMLPQALEVMAALGFTYKSGGAWAKQSTTGAKWAFGTGYIFRSASELLLVGTRGKPKFLSKSERNLWVAPIRDHSRKPVCVQEMIERHIDGARLEMFARQSRPGWASWGSEATKFDGGTNGTVYGRAV